MSKRTPRAILLYFSSPVLRHSAQFLAARCFSASSSIAPPSPHFFHSSTSSSSLAPVQTFRKHRNEDGSKIIRVTVWWDYENCPVPSGVNPYKVVQRITTALRAEGIRGPVSITAFADVHLLNRSCQEALFATGVSFNHVPRRGKNSSDKSILSDLVYWVAQNPPPAHFFLISGDGDFTSTLHRLRLNNYNILIATLDHASSALSSCATIFWHWNELLQSDCMTGKHFNQPPDGLYSSWYGQFKGSLDDPFYLDMGYAVSQPEECGKLPADLKAQPQRIPKYIVDAIVKTLSSYPNGLSAKELLIRLRKKKVVVDKNFFGYANFVDLVQSLRPLIRTTISRNGKVAICKLKSVEAILKMAESGVIRHDDEDQKGMLETDDTSPLLTLDPAGEDHHLAYDKKTSHESSQSSPFGELSFAKNKTLIFDPTKEEFHLANGNKVSHVSSQSSPSGEFLSAEHTLPCTDKDDVVDTVNKDTASVKNVDPVEHLQEEDPGTSKGFFGRLWTALVGRYSSKVTRTSSGDSTIWYTRGITGGTDKPLECSHVVSNKPGFFNKFAMWCNLKQTSAEKTQECEKYSRLTSELKNSQVKEGHEQKQQEVKCTDLKPAYHELFSKAQFWNSLESFISTEKAHEIVTKSRTRNHLVQGLQKEGPPELSSLTTSNITYLINLLISKKWMKECSSQIPPFKLIYPAKRSCIPSVDLASDELSNVLPSKELQSSTQTTLRDFGDEQGQGIIGTPSNRTVGKRKPLTLSEFKAWFQRVASDNSSIHVEDVKNRYKKEFGSKLDSFFYGYFNVEKLLDACSGSRETKGQTHLLSRQQILTDCEKLLTDALEKNPAGISLSAFSALFRDRYGYSLSLSIKELGYPQISSILELMPSVRLDLKSKLLLPVAALPPLPSGSDEDLPWEELGPVTDDVDKDNDRDQEKQPASECDFDDLSISDEEESLSDDDDGLTREPDRLTAPSQNSRKSEEESSLIKILESWHKSKNSNGNTESQSIVGLVDCSEGSVENPLPVESRPVVPLSSNFRVKRVRAYKFVSDSPAGKDRVANEILQCLK